MRDDESGWPVLVALVECLTQQLVRAEVPMPGFVGVLPGALPVQDYAADCGGQAWVRLVDAYPSVDFPTPDVGVNGFTGLVAVTVEVGITRCAPTADEQGPPTQAEQEEATRVQLADMSVMYLTLACCTGQDRRGVVGRYRPIGPEGGVLGGTWGAVLEG